MTCNSLDLTIDAAIADPMIRAAMRADRIDPLRFEAMLRATARRIDEARRTPKLPVAIMAERLRQGICEAKRGW